MWEYFLRRLLLTIPTFLGATLVVFVIIQLAPGGPLEQQIMALRMAMGGEAAAGGVAGQTGAMIPESALQELRRYYGFDKPILIRYLTWLGLWPRELESYIATPGRIRNIGGGQQVLVEKTPEGYRLIDPSTGNPLTGWHVEPQPSERGEERVRIYRTGFSGILTGDFGKSYTYNEPVLQLILQRLPVSLQFGLIGFILSYSICIYLGIQKALSHGTPFDLVSSTLVFIGYSIPGWALGAFLLMLFGTQSFVELFPLGGFQSEYYEQLSLLEKILDRAWHFVLPTIAYTVGSFASLTVLMKNSLLENLSQDYIRTAFAKGLSEKRVIWLHALRNSIIPITANIGYIIGLFLAGSYLIELVFNIDGVGKLSIEAVFARDYPIVFGFTVLAVLVRLFGAILSDLALALVDPRIRFK
ncbi:MAG: ABC transporter permease subunit [Candidatus Kapabacteria bacterium]|nr:ABC transporter permease subunit [Candidatus Kapabacteria bacterium]MDW8012979.1 ABC transporter permease subunit [Bacteroidota bacterium]